MMVRILLLLLFSTVAAALAETGGSTIEGRAHEALANKEADLRTHGNLLVQYADSLRTLDVELATKCLEVSGIAAFRSNQLDSAVVRWQRGVQWARLAGATKSESSLLNALAIGHTAKGDTEAALPVYDRSLELREALGDTMGLSRTWGNLATAYANIGRTAEALAATAEEEKWLAFVDNPRGRVANAIRSAQILSTMGRFDEALLEGRKAVKLAAGFDDKNLRGMAGMSLGNALLDVGQHQESLPVLSNSRDLLRESGDDFSAAFVEQSLINCLLLLNRPQEALTRLHVLIPEVEAAGQLPLLTVLLRYEGNALFALGRVAESESTLQAALELFERRRENLEDDRSRAGIFTASGEIYASLARCQLATGHLEEAFMIVERGRGAVFRDHMNQGALAIEELQTELEKNEAALVLFNDPVYDPLVAFVLDANGLQAVELGSIDPISADARAALRLLAAGKSLETCRPALARLELSLAGPVLSVVDSSVKRFSVIPPSFLAGFPLGVLRDSLGHGWGDTRPLSYLPNASAWLDLGARKSPQVGVLAFADPEVQGAATGHLPLSSARSQAGIPLPEARAEIASVALKKEQRRVGEAASGQELRHALNTPLAVLHLATHAVVDPIDGGRSAVVMAGLEGVDAVTAREISTFNFQGDLVVLSGCSTFGGHRVLGEGWFGLPRSFLSAGARSVVSTLWDVDDHGARQFITAFYTALAEGLPRDEALVRARQVCRREGMPPREWAAFVLTGVGNDGLALLADQKKSGKPLPLVLALSSLVIGGWFWRRR